MSLSLIELFRAYRPGKRRRSIKQPKLSNSNADAVWQECLDRDIYGANTPDYSLHTRRSAARQQPKPNR